MYAPHPLARTEGALLRSRLPLQSTPGAAMPLNTLRRGEQLFETERRLNAVLNNASVAIFLMDDRQHCIYMNRAAELSYAGF